MRPGSGVAASNAWVNVCMITLDVFQGVQLTLLGSSAPPRCGGSGQKTRDFTRSI